MISRREFLRLTAVSAAATGLPGFLKAAPLTTAGLALPAGKRVLVDWHSHFVTQAEIDFLSRRQLAPRIIIDAAGKPLLVDFTADWCLTCQVNKKTSIEIPSVREKIKALNAIALLADYTRTPDVITTELARFNRAGVPLVLVYPKDPAAPPQVLPEVLTPGIVLEALDRAAK